MKLGYRSGRRSIRRLIRRAGPGTQSRRFVPPTGIYAVVLAVVLTTSSCTGTNSVGPSGGGAPTAKFVTAPPLEAPCSPGGATVRLSAIHIQYSPRCLAARTNERIRLVFDNRDAGVRHNVHVLPGPRGYDTNPPTVFVGPIVKGQKTVVSTISSLPAGLLTFQCDLHPDQMRGLFAVAPVVSPATGSTGMGFVVSWATPADAPPGYVFDVQIRRPGSASFRDWRTRQSGYQATFVPDAPGTYAFRVSVYPAKGELRPIGYSPAGSIEVT